MRIAGDIGGTKTVLWATGDGGATAPSLEATYPSRDYDGLEPMLRAFRARLDDPDAIRSACVAVAGPVRAGAAEITNLPWSVDAATIGAALNTDAVRLINDAEATAFAIPSLGPDDVVTLQAGEPDPHGAAALIAPGTGLGEAFLTRDGDTYRAHPSEGGHADFAPRNAGEIGLLQYMRSRFSRVSYERVCSGSGLPYIYGYLSEIGFAPERPGVAAALDEAEDPTPVIVGAALDEDPCPLCVASVRTLSSILGAEAGNLALKALATGGVYLAGGLPRRILPFLKDRRFRTALHDKGRQTRLVARMPVHVITHPRAAVLGAAAYGSLDESR